MAEKLAASILSAVGKIGKTASANVKVLTTTVKKEVSTVTVNSSLGSATNSSTGQKIEADNPLVQSEEQAQAVAEWMANVLKNRLVMSGDFRVDPRIDVLDAATVKDKYTTSRVVMTSLTFTYNGAFRGRFEGRVMAEE